MDLSQNVVLYGDVLLPQEAFYTSDCSEMKLVAYIFETAKSIAELKLTETELALYQSLVLLWPGMFRACIDLDTFCTFHEHLLNYCIFLHSNRTE